VFWYYTAENESPRVTAKFLARQRRLLLPAQFAREHQNQWIDQADSFTSVDEVDAAMGQGWAEQMGGAPGLRYVLAVDLGAVHDPTVLGVGHEEGGRVYLDRLVTFQGSREAPVQLVAVEAAIQDLAERFPPDRIRVESWQGLSVAQALRRSGLPVEIFTPTAKAHAEEWPALAQRLVGRTLVLPPHRRLREELLNLIYEVGPTGVRVSDPGEIHQDHATVLRMIVAAFTDDGRANDLGISIGAWDSDRRSLLEVGFDDGSERNPMDEIRRQQAEAALTAWERVPESRGGIPTGQPIERKPIPRDAKALPKGPLERIVDGED
jgi:hypothetical protein